MTACRGAGTAGAAAPAALVVRGRTGAEKCPFLQDNSLHLHQNSVIHKRRIDEVSAKEVAKEFVEINEQRRIYFGQFE